MCHDINPLGTTMHLKELYRQAVRNRRPMSSTGAWMGTVKQRHLGAALRHAGAVAALFASPVLIRAGNSIERFIAPGLDRADPIRRRVG